MEEKYLKSLLYGVCSALVINKLTAALQNAVDKYGQPGGPWNVPNEPGTWISEAKHALELAQKLKDNG